MLSPGGAFVENEEDVEGRRVAAASLGSLELSCTGLVSTFNDPDRAGGGGVSFRGGLEAPTLDATLSLPGRVSR